MGTVRRKFVESFWMVARNVCENHPGFTGLLFVAMVHTGFGPAHLGHFTHPTQPSQTSFCESSCSRETTVSAEEVDTFEGLEMLIKGFKKDIIN